MEHLLELHILQNFAPSNLNSDDTGSPKDAYFGGVRRGRISSQCLKRSAREYVRINGLLKDQDLATRTKRIASVVAGHIRASGVEAALAEAVARTAISAIFKSELRIKGEQRQHLAKTLVYLNYDEAQAMAKVCVRHLAELQAISGEAAEQSRVAMELAEEKIEGLLAQIEDADPDQKKVLKKELSEAKKNLEDIKKTTPNVQVPKGILSELRGVFSHSKRSVDVALFGRMLAEVPRAEWDEAACQVAHAISTHAIGREFDFYTAVDDLAGHDEAASGMLGTTQFSSACYYRYMALDVLKLQENLSGNQDLVLQSIKAFLLAMVKAKPSGKQNSFAAHNDPDFVVVSVRKDADPRNLANAFEKPVRPSLTHSLSEASIERFSAKWKVLAEAYGGGGEVFRLNLTEATCDIGQGVGSLEELLQKTLEAVRPGLGA